LRLFNFDKTVSRINKKGLFGYFQIIRHCFFDLVLLNLVFAATCIPVFTIGAAYRALVSVCIKLAEDESISPVREFLKALGTNFLKSTLYTSLYSLLFTIIAFASAFYYNLAQQNIVFYFATALCLASLIVLFLMNAWFFPLCIKLNQGFFALFSNSFVLCFACFKESVIYLLTALVCTIIVLAFLPYSLPLVFVFPFSFTALASAHFTNDKITEIFK